MAENFVGADLDGLRGMANQMIAHSETIALIEHNANSRVFQLDQLWVGANADQFLREWQANHSRALRDAATLLREAGDLLHRNADDQQRTSDGLDSPGLIGSFFDGVQSARGVISESLGELSDSVQDRITDSWERSRLEADRRNWIQNGGLDSLERALEADRESRMRWWNGLPQWARDALLIEHPGLFNTPGEWPSELTARAREIVASDFSDRYSVHRHSDYESNELNLGLFHIGDSEVLLVSEMGDGTYTVQYSDRFNAGLGRELAIGDHAELKARLGLFGEESKTWSLDSKAEADAFVEAFHETDRLSEWKTNRVFHAAAYEESIVGHTSLDPYDGYRIDRSQSEVLELMDEFERREGYRPDWDISPREVLLDEYRANLIADQRWGGVYGDLGFESPFVDIETNVEFQLSHDSVNRTDHARGVVETHGSLGLGPASVESNTVMEVELISGRQGDQLVLRMIGDQNLGVDLAEVVATPVTGIGGEPPLSVDLKNGDGVYAEVVLDMNDPAMRELAEDFIRDPLSSRENFREVLDNGEVIVQTFEQTSSETGLGLVVLDHASGEQTETATTTIIRPAGGTAQVVDGR